MSAGGSMAADARRFLVGTPARTAILHRFFASRPGARLGDDGSGPWVVEDSLGGYPDAGVVDRVPTEGDARDAVDILNAQWLRALAAELERQAAELAPVPAAERLAAVRTEQRQPLPDRLAESNRRLEESTARLERGVLALREQVRRDAAEHERVRLAAEAVVRAVDDPGKHPDVHARVVSQTVAGWPGLMRRVDDLRTALQRTGGP